ncbi:Amino-acid acetyltransferase, mitochondrial [Podila epigama]|nr:Amino-acid acetyltransferase, mitochondrial [Podila epigama]
MWRPQLTRLVDHPPFHTAKAICLSHGITKRAYSLRSPKIQALVYEHKKAQEKDRELILKVMGTLPSPREARQFLSKFSAPAVTTNVLDKEQTVSTSSNSSSSSSGTGFVDSLLWPKDHLALIKLEGPFEEENLVAAANTLVQLQRLGLLSVVMLDNQTWWQQNGEFEGGIAVESDQDPSAAIRRKMMKDMFEVVEVIEKAGGKARPVYEGVFDSEDSESLPQSQALDQSANVPVQAELGSLQSCLKLRQIPVLVPMATSRDCRWIPVQSNKALVALAKRMGETAHEETATSGTAAGSMVPMRLIIINTTGGLPLKRADGIQGPTHCFVNLKDEYKSIVEDLDNMNHIPESVALSYRSDLDMIKDSLNHLPRTCSALITASPSLTLITNLITDKPLFSSTMRNEDPKGTLATTVLRSGLDIFTFRNSTQGLDLNRLQQLLESSFGKPLDAPGFYERIRDTTKTVILAGQDYMGAAIVTREGGLKDGKQLATVAYLDKFSVAPKSQGIGVADILWKKLQDEFPDLVWRSRSDNPVNKWYFDRADGNIRIPNTNWTMFWYGPKGLGLIRDYIEISRDIPASFLSRPTK